MPAWRASSSEPARQIPARMTERLTPARYQRRITVDNADTQTVSASETILRAASRRRHPEAPAPTPIPEDKVTFVIEDGPPAILARFAARVGRGRDGKYRVAVARDRVAEVDRQLHEQGVSFYAMDHERL